MFNEIYKIVNECNDFDDLKRKLDRYDIDARDTDNLVFWFTSAAQLAIEGKNDKVVWMRQLGANVDDIALGYAFAGNHEQVEFYRIQHNADVNFIAYGYIKAKRYEHVEIYRTQNNASVDAIAYGYAAIENHERVETYSAQHHANVNDIARGYKHAFNHEKRQQYDIKYILKCYLKQRTAMVDANGITKEYLHCSFFSCFQKSYRQKREAVSALKQALKGEKVDLITHLETLRNGTLGNELRQFIKSGMGNGIVGKAVNTVSDFVQALQEQCFRGKGLGATG